MADTQGSAPLPQRALTAVIQRGEGNVWWLPAREKDVERQQAPSLAHVVDQRASRRLMLRIKRAIDVAAAIVGLTAMIVLMPLIGLAICLDSPGGVFYSQTRIGINRRRRRVGGYGTSDRRKIVQPGRPFRIHKLRTMRTDAERDGPQWASKGDARVTRVGRLLRATRLDEVPQFLNVLRGEMSLIGPRPERLCFIHKLEKDVPDYRDRLLVLPGITGLAQVINGYDGSVEAVRRKVELDRQYIRDFSLAADLRIVCKTIKVVLTGEGAC